MTTIRKLSLQGIRSYSDQNAEVIEFFKPLTIIVGANGSGKTTIIEALKYVCTGTQPPLSDGGKSFVHDPKIVGASIVKAQIKLGFRTAEDRPVLAVRSFQLQQKKATRQYKQIESVLRSINSSGQQVSMSHRCADMEKQVPQLMGVSKAVLENVIFCHQEESNWPLSESKKVKEKFDDIFASTRFSKALEVIRKLRTEKSKEIKEMQADLKVLENNLENAHKLESDLEHCKSRIREKTDKIGKIELDIKEIETTLGEMSGKADSVQRLKDEIKKLETERGMMLAEKERAAERMLTEYSDTDAQLEQYYSQFRNDLKRLEERLSQARIKQESLQQKLAKAHANLNQSHANAGKLSALLADNSKRRTDLEAARRRCVGLFALPIDDEKDTDRSDFLGSMGRFVLLIESVAQDRDKQLQQFKTEAQRTDSKFEKAMLDLQRKSTTVQSSIKLKTESLAGHKAKLDKIKERIRQNVDKMGGDKDFTEQIQEADGKLKDFNARDPSESMKATIDSKNRRVTTNSSQLTVLASERNKLSTQQLQLTQLKVKREQQETLRRQYNANVEKLTQAVQGSGLERFLPNPMHSSPQQVWDAVFGGDKRRYQAETLQEELSKQQATASEQERRFKEQLESARGNVSGLEGQLKMVEDNLKRLEREIDQSKTQIRTVGFDESKEYEQEIINAQQELSKAKDKRSLTTSLQKLYASFVSKAKEEHKCPICIRSFKGGEEEKFQEVVAERLHKMNPEAAAKLKDECKQLEDVVVRLQKMSGVWADFNRASKVDRPSLSEKRAKLKRSFGDAQQEADACHRDQKRLSSQLSSLSSWATLAGEVSRTYRDLSDLLQSISQDDSRLKAMIGSGRSLEEVNKEIESIERENLTLNRELAELQEKLERVRVERHELQTRLNQARDRQMEQSKIQTEKDRLVKEGKEIRATMDQLQVEIKELETRVEPIKVEIDNHIAERSRVKKTNDDGENLLNQGCQEVHKELNNTRLLLDRVREMDNPARVKERAELEHGSKAAVAELQDIKTQLASAEKEIQDNQSKVDKSSSMEQDIQANLDFRNRQKACIRQNTLIEQKKEELKKLTDDADLFTDLAEFRKEVARLSTTKAEIGGGLKIEEEHAKALITDLHTDKYHQIDDRHRVKLIECETTSMANVDLETYSKALDKALMHYHSIKMKEINDVLRELWRITYRGKDIDEVYIKSEANEDGNSKRRNYNYRVVMKQGDTELDMRGRCSAGQKVLASLLIRLALAETFCLQCGILALDEPTTNLDASNVKAFAQALNDIISRRRGQKNFQLILITHDEKFVDEIGKRAHCDYYYRIYKDLQNHSKIRKQNIHI